MEQTQKTLAEQRVEGIKRTLLEMARRQREESPLLGPRLEKTPTRLRFTSGRQRR